MGLVLELENSMTDFNSKAELKLGNSQGFDPIGFCDDSDSSSICH